MSQRILGIDPGIGITGYGIIDREGNQCTPVVYGVIRTLSGNPEGERLCALSDGLIQLIEEYRPEVAAVERLFFSRNVTTGIAVAQARGVILLELARAAIPCMEYTPNQVKQGVTGSGRAGKAQVQEMVCRLLGIVAFKGPDDAADALAVAMTYSPGMGIVSSSL